VQRSIENSSWLHPQFRCSSRRSLPLTGEYKKVLNYLSFSPLEEEWMVAVHDLKTFAANIRHVPT